MPEQRARISSGIAECRVRDCRSPCPEAGKLHVQSESIYCEVVDEDGKPTDGTGRLLVTSLNNFAAPLLRFDTEVQVKWGEPCTCGRGLQVLEAPE